MYRDLKYALDRLFLFMLAISMVLFVLEPADFDPALSSALKTIDLALLSGYYFIFGHGLLSSRRKAYYLRQHWLLLVLLFFPLIPLARYVEVPFIQRTLKIFSDTLWEFLDELELL